MKNHKYIESAELLKAIGHPARLCILKGLMENKGCNVTKMCECMELPQSTISQHLIKMKNLKILKVEKKGLESFYTIQDKRIIEIIKILI